MPGKIKIAPQSGEILDPVSDGTIRWVDDEVIGFWCGCGGKEILTLGIYKDNPTECPSCHARLYYRQRIEVIEVKDRADG